MLRKYLFHLSVDLAVECNRFELSTHIQLQIDKDIGKSCWNLNDSKMNHYPYIIEFEQNIKLNT